MLLVKLSIILQKWNLIDMGYIEINSIIEARKYVKDNINKPDTFMGLIMFLMCVIDRKRNGSYLITDMKKFSMFADNAFYLSDPPNNYPERYWYALLTNDWIDQVKINFLRNKTVSAKFVFQSLFWQDSVEETKSRMKLIPDDIYKNFFIDDMSDEFYIRERPVSRSELLRQYNGEVGTATIKFDNSFIRKRASDLSGAPFAQTLYAANEIKKTIAVFDFDFMDKYNLIDNNVTLKKKTVKNVNNIEKNKDAFRKWMIQKGLSEKTALSYSVTGINFCDKYLESLNLNVKSLYQLDAVQALEVLARLNNIDEWLRADQRGNSMYSASCKRYIEFMSEKSDVSYMNLSKPFLILAGISGTGKTRFVREQARYSSIFTETYCLTSVRPDWHEPSDLLGYISRINGASEYITTDVLQFIAKAWRGILDSGLSIGVENINGQGDTLVVTGDLSILTQVLPYWLCLDEMNLAPVEQYFADYLSVLETREWHWSGESFIYRSDALLKAATINETADRNKLRQDLGFGTFEDGVYNEFWELICQHGLGIPFNLIVAGTVNMDETTHGFSRKVLDRALSFDFGAFFPNNYDDFFTPKYNFKRLSYPIWSHASKAVLVNTFDFDGSKSVAFLSGVNSVLVNTPFELAFRALNELLLSVMCARPIDELSLMAVWDDFMMCKVLPRIEGDVDKLTTAHGKPLLLELNKLLENQLEPIWKEEIGGQINLRPDLFREKIENEEINQSDNVIQIPCRSKEKLKWMSDRLATATFTSFWP
jgi:hypothetical protein